MELALLPKINRSTVLLTAEDIALWALMLNLRTTVDYLR